jgi:hypothetical protein
MLDVELISKLAELPWWPTVDPYGILRFGRVGAVCDMV